MAELLEAAASWEILLIVLAIYGFAPGFVLRLLVKLYPKTDPRRTELLAELYTIPRLWRPFWVADALGAVLIEGLPHRVSDIRDKRRAKKSRSAREKATAEREVGQEPRVQEDGLRYPVDEGRKAAPRGWGRRDSHLLPDAIVAFVDDELTPAAQDRASTHLARCQACAAEVAAQRHGSQ